MAYNIDFDKIYECANIKYGTFKIIEDLGNDKSRHRKVKIRFLNTGNEKEVRMEHVLTGNVRDTMLGIDFDKDYESKRCGTFRITKILPNQGVGRNRMVEIRFNDTGYTRPSRLEHALSGNVIDKSIPQIYGQP